MRDKAQAARTCQKILLQLLGMARKQDLQDISSKPTEKTRDGSMIQSISMRVSLNTCTASICITHQN